MKIRRIIYLGLILLIVQVSKETLSGIVDTPVLEESFRSKESNKQMNIHNPKKSLGVFFNLLKIV